MTKRILLFLLLVPLALTAQRITTEEYIQTYKDIAMEEMRTHGIPASITLAQGLLESGSGNSALARDAKNHFGIKCHTGWQGQSYIMDDDERNECFRRYSQVEESFRDHSEFLRSRSRYAGLFELDIMDYEGWANGLKAAGYATNPAYATSLIGIIDRNRLYLYDQLAMGIITEAELNRILRGEQEATPSTTFPVEERALELAYSPVDRSGFVLVDMTAEKRFIYENNHVRFAYAKEGETLERIAEAFHIRVKDLCKYNLITRPDEMVFHYGDIVYLEQLRKRNRTAKTHVVQVGETVRDVALHYAVRPGKILKRNGLSEGEPLQPGQVLKLR